MTEPVTCGFSVFPSLLLAERKVFRTQRIFLGGMFAAVPHPDVPLMFLGCELCFLMAQKPVLVSVDGWRTSGLWVNLILLNDWG